MGMATHTRMEFSMKICVFFATAANVFRIANGITNLATDIPCGIDLATIQSQFEYGKFLSKSPRVPRIVNGVNARPLEFPWIVSFQYKKSGRHFCSGFVIHRRYVLSALHCFQDDMAVGHTLPLRILKARLGEYDLTSGDNGGYNGVDFDIEKIIGHPNFEANHHLHDIALIRLNKDIEWSPNIRPLCLPSNSSSSSSSNNFDNNHQNLATISGWGSVRVEPDGIGELAKILQKSRVRIIERDVCKNWLSQNGIDWTPQKSHVCAGFEEGGTDVCWGDSGGPLVNDFGSQNFAVGIVSAGRSCAIPKHPTVYTSVEFYLDWIKANIEK